MRRLLSIWLLLTTAIRYKWILVKDPDSRSKSALGLLAFRLVAYFAIILAWQCEFSISSVSTAASTTFPVTTAAALTLLAIIMVYHNLPGLWDIVITSLQRAKRSRAIVVPRSSGHVKAAISSKSNVDKLWLLASSPANAFFTVVRRASILVRGAVSIRYPTNNKVVLVGISFTITIIGPAPISRNNFRCRKIFFRFSIRITRRNIVSALSSLIVT